MLQTILSRLGWFVLLMFLQVLVFNHIHILGYATPMPYVYLLLILADTTPRWVYVVTGFALGFCIDLFTNTPGMAAASLCACGLLVPVLLKVFRPKDTADEEIVPSVRSMEWGGFLRFAFCAVLLHCTFFFLIEAFSVEQWRVLLANIGGSTVLTLLAIAGFELITARKRR